MKKHGNMLIVIILIMIVTISIGYSSFSKQLGIDNLTAVVRDQSDIRITNIIVESSSEDGTSLYEEYDRDNISLGVNLPNENSTITYKITLTNYGNVETQLDSILGLNDNLQYSLGNYNLEEKICNDNNECSLGISKDILLTISYKTYDSSNTINSIKLDFEFSESTNVLYKLVGKNAELDTSVNFQNEDVETGIFTLLETSEMSNPVHYYRGEPDNNNIIFAGFCWKIVRTTTTGGTKIVYNGIATNNKCDNIGNPYISNSTFSIARSSPSDVGYIFGTERYEIETKSMSDTSNVYYFANDVYWNGTTYELIEPMISTNDWANDRKKLATKYKYTCFSNSASSKCQKIHYISDFSNESKAFYYTLTGGKKLEDMKNNMFDIPQEILSDASITKYDSAIKTVIDTWYIENLIDYTNFIENTNWCNDKTIGLGALSSKDDGNESPYNYFAFYTRNRVNNTPSIYCDNPKDELKIGNGLKYPVALLTGDEYILSGMGKEEISTGTYLSIGTSNWTWTMSPFRITDGGSTLGAASTYLTTNFASLERAARPSISLKEGTVVTGKGTLENPYIVDYENTPKESELVTITITGDINKSIIVQKGTDLSLSLDSELYEFEITSDSQKEYTIENNILKISNITKATTIIATGYIEADYLEGDGTAYIDTEYKPNSDTKTEIEFMKYLTDADKANPLYGSRVDFAPETFTTFIYNSTIRVDYNMTGAANFYTTDGYETNTKNRLIQSKDGIILNNLEAKAIEQSIFNGQNTMYLFSVNTSGLDAVTKYNISEIDAENNYSNFYGRVYSFKIFDQGTTLVRDFVPVYTKSNQIAGMFDLVNHKFYGNQQDLTTYPDSKFTYGYDN